MCPPKLTLAKVSNILLNRAETRLGQRRMLSRPSSVDVVLTKACNLACSFCRDYEHEGSKRVSLENMESVAAQLFPSASWVNICSGGEPYLHNGLEHLLRLARKHGAKTWVLSNGMLLKQARLEAMLEEELIVLHGFSVDGIDPKTVESIRTNADLPTILANIDMLIALRQRAGLSEPAIVIRYALMRRNIEELPRAVEYWGARGVSRIDCGYLVLANGIPREESLFYHQDLMKKHTEAARQVAARFPEMQLRLPPSVEEERKKLASPQACRAPWNFVMIDASGYVLPCYRAFEALQMGRLHGDGAQSFDEIWNGPQYQALRRTVNQSGAKAEGGYGYCRVCENRFGWSTPEVHLGDETWIRKAFNDPSRAENIDHRRNGFKPMQAPGERDSNNDVQ